jgi:hypothetical protein
VFHLLGIIDGNETPRRTTDLGSSESVQANKFLQPTAKYFLEALHW